MVLDTSAIMAIHTREPAADRLVQALEADRTRLVSAATVVEASLVLLGRYGDAGEAQLDRLDRKSVV
jgi:ribonuclease VapC